MAVVVVGVLLFEATIEILLCAFQPLTDFSSKKCKRCGFYEKDRIVADDVFDEWELCPSDFTALDGKYIRFKEKEFNATFLCPECLSFSGGECLAAFFCESTIYLFDLADNCVTVTYLCYSQNAVVTSVMP